MRKFLLVLLIFITVGALTACNKSSEYEGIDGTTSGEIDILMWNGDGLRHEDIGSMNWTADDITGQTVAGVYAVAKEFKELYPNIKINLTTKAYGPDDYNPDGTQTTWEQEIDSFKSTNGKYPDIWVTNDVTRDLEKGLILDFSMFENDPVYQSYNDSLLSMTNFYGFQAAIPQYAIPYGIYVNRELAETYNIDAPDPDWTWDEYTDFVTQAPTNADIYGSYDSSMDIIRANYVEVQLQTGSVSDAYIDVNTTTFKDLIRSLSDQSNTALVSQQGLGNVTDDFISAHGDYPLNFFADGNLLTLRETRAASELGNVTVSGMRTEIQSGDWDYYPSPALTEEDGNLVNLVYDPLVMYNYAGTDNVCNEAEEAKANMAYAFISYYTASTEAMQARADQMFTSGTNTDGSTIYKSALNDSLPLITGDEYEKQMDIWYSIDNHADYEDADRFPGWAEVVKLWEAGKIAGISDKSYPLSYRDDANNEINCLYFVDYFGIPDYNGGETIDSPYWYSTYVSLLAEANTLMNSYFDEAFKGIQIALVKYYSFDADSFNLSDEDIENSVDPMTPINVPVFLIEEQADGSYVLEGTDSSDASSYQIMITKVIGDETTVEYIDVDSIEEVLVIAADAADGTYYVSVMAFAASDESGDSSWTTSVEIIIGDTIE